MIEQQRLLNAISNLVDKGEITTTSNNVIRPINAANLRKAHAMIERGDTIGKVVLADWQRGAGLLAATVGQNAKSFSMV